MKLNFTNRKSPNNTVEIRQKSIEPNYVMGETIVKNSL